MISRTRLYVSVILLGATMAGCTPAHFVQRAQVAPQHCEVQVCANQGSLERCGCSSSEQVRRKLREAGWLEM